MKFEQEQEKEKEIYKEIKKRANSRTNLPVYLKAFPFDPTEDRILQYFPSAKIELLSGTQETLEK